MQPEAERHKLLLVLVLLALCLPSVITWLYFVTFAGSTLMGAVYTTGKVVQFCLPLVWFLGPGRPELTRALLRPRGVIPGAAFGIAVAVGMALLYAALRSTPLFDDVREQALLRLQSFGLDSPAGFVALAVFYSLAHSFLEEYYWRWFVYGGLRRYLNLPLAVTIGSLGFAAHHVIVLVVYFRDQIWFALLCSAGVAVGGAVWSVLFERSRSLVGIWVSHLVVDAAIMAIGWHLLFGG